MDGETEEEDAPGDHRVDQGEASEKTVATRDFYAVLGVPQTAIKREIEVATRRLLIRYHPDRTGRDTNAQVTDVIKIKNVLLDPSEKAAYDQWREWRRRSPMLRIWPPAYRVRLHRRVTPDELEEAGWIEV